MPRASSADGLAKVVQVLGNVRVLQPRIAPGRDRHQPAAQRTGATGWSGPNTFTPPTRPILEPPIPEREIVARAASDGAPLNAYGAQAGTSSPRSVPSQRP